MIGLIYWGRTFFIQPCCGWWINQKMFAVCCECRAQTSLTGCRLPSIQHPSVRWSHTDSRGLVTENGSCFCICMDVLKSCDAAFIVARHDDTKPGRMFSTNTWRLLDISVKQQTSCVQLTNISISLFFWDLRRNGHQRRRTRSSNLNIQTLETHTEHLNVHRSRYVSRRYYNI